MFAATDFHTCFCIPLFLISLLMFSHFMHPRVCTSDFSCRVSLTNNNSPRSRLYHLLDSLDRFSQAIAREANIEKSY